MQQILYILLTFVLPACVGSGILCLVGLIIEIIRDLPSDIKDFIRRPRLTDLRFILDDIALIMGSILFICIGVLGIIASLTA